MVISFSNPVAKGRLFEYGAVVTFRPDRRANPNGDNWANEGRGTGKIADVRISEIGPTGTSRDALDLWAKPSGFANPTAWRGAIRSLHDEVPDSGWLYLVTLIKDHRNLEGKGRFQCRYCHEEIIGFEESKEHTRTVHPKKKGRLTVIQGP